MCKDDANETSAQILPNAPTSSRSVYQTPCLLLVQRRYTAVAVRPFWAFGVRVGAVPPGGSGAIFVRLEVFVGLARVLHPKSPLSGKAWFPCRASVVGGVRVASGSRIVVREAD